MSEWKEYKLGEIVDIKHGYAFKGKFFSIEATKNILITPGNFKIGGGYKGNKLKYYNGFVPDNYILNHKDIIVTMTDLSKQADTLGYSAKVPNDDSKVFLHNQRIGLVEFKNNSFNPEFIYWLMRAEHYQKFVAGSATGATVKHTSPTKIRAFKFKAPSNDSTRKKIAKILSNYDDLIENNLKRIKLLEESARLTYEEWYVRRRINEEVVPDKDIEMLLMEEMLTDYMNGGWGKEEPTGNYKQEAYVIRGTDMPDISEGNFLTLPLRFHTESNLKPRRLDIGNIAIEMSNGNIGNVGRSFYFDEGTQQILNKPVMCASFCKMIKPKSRSYSYIIDSHLKYIHATNKMIIYKSQGANGINNFRFENMINEEIINVPKGNFLDSFVDKVEVIYSEMSNLRVQIKFLKEARNILLPRLMTGMIDVDELEVAV